MDPGPSLSKNEKTKVSNSVSDVRDVPKSSRIRRNSDDLDEINRVLFRSQFGFVLACSALFWFLFLILWL
jgi:hypothetical protein